MRSRAKKYQIHNAPEVVQSYLSDQPYTSQLLAVPRGIDCAATCRGPRAAIVVAGGLTAELTVRPYVPAAGVQDGSRYL